MEDYPKQIQNKVGILNAFKEYLDKNEDSSLYQKSVKEFKNIDKNNLIKMFHLYI